MCARVMRVFGFHVYLLCISAIALTTATMRVVTSCGVALVI